MEYRNLGNSGLQVSLAGLGTNNFGRRCDAAQAETVVHKAFELGVNLIDTADQYGDGLSEEYIGRAIKGIRRDVVVATKFERPTGKGPLRSGTSRRHLMDAVHDSMRRLELDYVDLYQMHYWDPTTPIEETMRALDDLVHRGDVRYIGCSNFSAWQIVESQWVARSEHLTPLISAQNAYNLLERSVERDTAPVAQRYGMSLIPYSPLSGGFLTGKYRQGQSAPEGTRFSSPTAYGRQVINDENFSKLEKLERFAAERDHTVGELALAWLASQPSVASIIAGATRSEQVEENVRAVEWRLSTEDMAALDETLGASQSAARGAGRAPAR